MIKKILDYTPPKYLQPYTKENLLFQIGATVIVCGGMYLYYGNKEEREFRKFAETRFTP